MFERPNTLKKGTKPVATLDNKKKAKKIGKRPNYHKHKTKKLPPIIEVNNLSKQYRLGKVGTGTLSHDINRWWHRMRGKEDPYLKIGQANDRTTKGESEYVWALRDINFTVQPGEVLGIIGRNGAGKSTLLKILSRITAPTTGSVTLRGRVAALLEVGTGMHPELTGRENIYLNGAILGMRKKEIDRKLDAIVDFAGVERYLDTPVKRYSSGMHVRLGFAVAAHLEPDILIVDEVLAVGDAEFQKKCIGKMQNVSREEGRAVLFVSHNMQAISNLTNRCLVLGNSTVAFNGITSEGISHYLQREAGNEFYFETAPRPGVPTITKISLSTSRKGNIHEHGKPFLVSLEIQFYEEVKGLALSFQILDSYDNAIIHSWVYDKDIPLYKEHGINRVRCTIPKLRLYMGNYYFVVHFANYITKEKYQLIEKVCHFEVDMFGIERIHRWMPDACRYIEETVWSCD